MVAIFLQKWYFKYIMMILYKYDFIYSLSQ